MTEYKISDLASYIDGEKCSSTGGKNFAQETRREGNATIKQIAFWNKLPKKQDAPFTKIDIDTLSNNVTKPEIKSSKSDEPMITVPVKWLEEMICQR